MLNYTYKGRKSFHGSCGNGGGRSLLLLLDLSLSSGPGMYLPPPLKLPDIVPWRKRLGESERGGGGEGVREREGGAGEGREGEKEGREGEEGGKEGRGERK